MFFSFVLLVSVSSGQSQWVQQNSGTAVNLNDIFFINQNTGWAAGDDGTILKTTNGGVNWFIQNSGVNYILRRVYFINTNTGWIAGGTSAPPPGCSYTGIALKTTNGGNNWTSINTFGSYLFTDMCVLNTDTLYLSCEGRNFSCVGTGASIYYSPANNWSFSTLNAGLGYGHTSVDFIDNQTGYIAAVYETDSTLNSRKLFKTTNFGLNWNLIKSESEPGTPLGGSFIRFIDTSTGYYIDNNFYKTTNGGTNWTKLDSASVFGMTLFNFLNTNTGYAVGRNRIVKTNTGGTSWQTNSGTLFTSLNSVYAIDTNHVWACGANGKIIFGGNIVGVQNISGTVPDKFSLYQNYPNPFNPVTNIKFDIPKSSFTTLKVYNALGKEIAVLLNEIKSAGSYQVDFDASALTSGVYFYRIETETFTETKRLMLLK